MTSYLFFIELFIGLIACQLTLIIFILLSKKGNKNNVKQCEKNKEENQ